MKRTTSVYDNWKWIWQYVKKYKHSIFRFLNWEIACTVIELVLSILIQQVIDRITNKELNGIVVFIVVFILLQLFEVFVHTYTGKIHLKVHHHIQNDMQLHLYENILSQTNIHPIGHKIVCMEKDIGHVAETILNQVPGMITSLICMLGAILLLVYYDIPIAIIAICSIPILLFLYFQSISTLLKNQKDLHTMQDEKLEESITTFQQPSYQSISKHVQFMQQLQHKDLAISLRQYTYQSNKHIVITIAGRIISFICYGMVIWQLFHQKISIGTAILLFTMISNVHSSLEKIVGWIPDVVQASISAQRIRKWME